MARAWIPATILSMAFFLVALELSVFGFPFAAVDPDSLLSFIWLLLLVSLVMLMDDKTMFALMADLHRDGARQGPTVRFELNLDGVLILFDAVDVEIVD